MLTLQVNSKVYEEPVKHNSGPVGLVGLTFSRSLSATSAHMSVRVWADRDRQTWR